jgi:hypothetical protein
LALGIAQYSARIFELRREGFQIENRTERAGDVRRSWFRLLDSSSSPPPTEVHKPIVPWEDRPRVTGLELFDAAVRR